MFEIDTAIVKSLPPVLEPLSQTPGSMLSISYRGGAIGPLAVTGLGLWGALAFVVMGTVIRRERSLAAQRREREESSRRRRRAKVQHVGEPALPAAEIVESPAQLPQPPDKPDLR